MSGWLSSCAQRRKYHCINCCVRSVWFVPNKDILRVVK